MAINTVKKSRVTKSVSKADLLKSHFPPRQTPYITTDLAGVREKALQFAKLLPNVGVYYAIKANRDLQVIQTIDDHVAGYDIASGGELAHLLKLGIDPQRILYSNPVKIPAHVKFAYKSGVNHFAFDSISEIEKLAKNAPGSNVYLRLKVADYGSKFPLSKKFGVDPLHAVDYCSLAQDAGLNVVGITFHVGSQSENVQVWKTALDITAKTIHKLENKGFKLEFLDLGGGFPADYGEPVPALADIAKTIQKAIDNNSLNHLRLIAEPGRYITAEASTMVTSVIGREHRSGSDWLYLDVGTFQGLIEPLEMPDWKYPVSVDEGPEGYHKDFILTGPTCDAYDTIGTNYLLPADIKVGDKIYIASVGAYAGVYGSKFNGFGLPKQYYIDSSDKAYGRKG